MKNIVCFHLFNDYSGSPKVLKGVLKGLAANGHEIKLYTSRGGVLDELKGLENIVLEQYNYRFARNVFIRTLRYAWVQVLISMYALRYMFRRDVVFYINTILPVGPALVGRLTGKKVLYHYHENAKAKSRFYRLLAWFMKRLAHEVICVSEYQKIQLGYNGRVTTIPNSLQQEFAQRLKPDATRAFADKRVLMLGSLKRYKGTDEFIGLARMLPQFNFELVLNEEIANIEAYLKAGKIEVPSNLVIHPRQNDVAQFYNRASLVLNLSNKDLFIETFGLTALEAMTAGLPVIVPTVGGIAEMVEDGENGYRIDVQDIGKIAHCVEEILTDEDLFITLAKNALKYSAKFSEGKTLKMTEQVLTELA